MINALSLGGYSLLSSQILLTAFKNGSFPATVYTRSKRGGYQGNKLITPTFASYSLVLDFTIVGLSFADLATQRFNFFAILGLIHSLGSQTLIITKSDGVMLEIPIKAVQVVGDVTADDGVSAQIEITLEAEYPFLQNSSPKNQDVLLQNGGGMAIPMRIPLNMSAGQSNQVVVMNAGNYAAYPIFTFTGPLSNPTITNNSTGEEFGLTYSLATNTDIIIADTYLRSVVIHPSGNIGRQYAVGKFWTIPVGASNVSLGGTGLGKVTISYRDTFLGI